MQILVGNTVERIKGDYVVGRIGEVIEIDESGKRARVKWTGRMGNSIQNDKVEIIKWPESEHVRTWVQFKVIKVIS